jgi:hemin uptake protein HemP
MSETKEQEGRKPEEKDVPLSSRTIYAAELFGNDREIWIEHGGVRYRLRITRRNKLILQK